MEEKPKRSKKKIILTALIVVALVVCSITLYLYIVSTNYFSTDNAKVTAKMYFIMPTMPGELMEWNVKEGQKVTKNQVLGRQKILPYITSPIDGTVVQNNGLQGETVNLSTQLAVVADTDNLYIGVNVEETNISKVKVGQAVDVKLDAYPNQTFKGVISEINQTTQTYLSGSSSFSTSGTYTKVTQLIPIKVLIENKDNLPLTFGMNATVKIHLKGTAEADLAVIGNEQEATNTTGAFVYNSSIEAANQVTVSPDISGRVTQINVEVGQKVSKGDVLYVLDSATIAIQVSQAAANNSVVNATYASALDNLNRMQSLFNAGAIAKISLDQATTQEATARAQLQGAQAALALAQTQLNNCTVIAPISGEVSQKNISVGDMVSPQNPAVTLIDAQTVLININVTESKIANVEIGAKAEVSVQAIGATYQGIVENIAPASDAQTGMFPVQIRVDNEDGKIKPGMMADVTLQNE
ncbi:MAG: efflux RND transporter periplasmic adaptor subunit [Clostridia bacterium]|nr:efflux RND transporter periplasmic adaptor subunit [Clostridia bacterium]